MAGDKMKLELLLKGRDQLSSVVKKQLPLLKSLDRDANKAFNSLKKLFGLKPKSDFGKQFSSDIRKSNTEAAKLKKTLEQISNIKIKSPKISTPSIPSNTSPSNASPKTNPERGEKELDKIYGRNRKPRSYVEKLANLNDKVIEPIGQVKNVWKEQISGLQEYTEETKKLLLAQSKFKLINLTAEENKKAFEAVNEVVRKFGTVTRTEGIETLTDLHTAIGSLDHAIEALPDAAKYRFSMKTLFADKFSESTIEEQIQNAYKFLEVTGKVAKGQKEMSEGFNVLTQMTNATGGRVTPSEMLLMGRRAGASGRNLSPEGLRNLSAPIQELGGDKAGTALMSMYQALVGGTMKEYSKEEFNRLGLIDQSKIEYGKGQKIKKLLPGANKLGDLMMTDPLSAADMLREAMTKHGINTNDPKEISKELTVLFGNRNAQNLMDILINQRGQVVKESDLAKNAQGNDKMYEGMDKQLKDLKMVENAWIDLKTKAGIPLIQTFSKLAETATPILNFFAEHETLTKWALAALIAGKAIKGVSETASIFSGSGLLSFFKNSQSSANTAKESLQSFSKEANGLKSKNIGVGLQIASVVGIDLLIRLIEWEIGKAMEAQTSRNAAKDAIKTGNKAWDNYVGELAQKGKKPSNSEVDSQASTAFLSSMNLGLKDVLPSQIYKKKLWSFSGDSILGQMANETYLYPFAPKNEFRNGFFDKRGDKNSLAEGFRKTAPELGKDPQIMASFIRLLEAKIPDKKDQQTVKDGLATLNAETYAKAVQINAENANRISESFMALITPTGSVVEQFLSLQGKSSDAVTGVSNLANATTNAANRINNLEIIPPTFATINIPTTPNQTQSSNPFSLFGRARGGSVTRGKTYPVGENGIELFTAETSGSVISNDILRNSKKSVGAGVHINFNPTINVNSGNSNATQIRKEIKEEMSFAIRELKKELSPDKLANRVGYAVGRYSERS